jgi:hypothetical protein
LAVPFHPGNSEDLVVKKGKGNVLHRGKAAIVVDSEALHPQKFLALPRNGFRLDAEDHLPANHHLRELLRGSLGDRHGSHPFALPQNCHSVADGHGLVKFVGDEDHSFSLIAEGPNGSEKGLHFLFGEDGGGLIEG